MNVKIEVELNHNPSKEDAKEMYLATKNITNNEGGINIFPHKSKPILISEFTIEKEKQVLVVDKIGKEFSLHMANYCQLSISFPKKLTTIQKKIISAASKLNYTEKQGQYLSFILYYEKINGSSPSERDMQKYFKTTPPTVHSMIIRLEEKGFIERTPRQARSIKLLLPKSKIPDLV